MSTMNQTGKQICNGQLKGDPKRTHDHPMFIRLLANDTSKLAMSFMSWDCYKEDPLHPLQSLMLHGYYEVGLLQGGPSSPSMNLNVACILLVAEGCHLPPSPSFLLLKVATFLPPFFLPTSTTLSHSVYGFYDPPLWLNLLPPLCCCDALGDVVVMPFSLRSLSIPPNIVASPAIPLPSYPLSGLMNMGRCYCSNDHNLMDI